MGSGPKQQAPAPPPEIKAPTPTALPTGPYGGLGYAMPGRPQAPSWATGAWNMGPVFNARGGSQWGNPQAQAQAPAQAPQQSGQAWGMPGGSPAPAIPLLQSLLGNYVRDAHSGRPWQAPQQMQSPYMGNPWG